MRKRLSLLFSVLIHVCFLLLSVSFFSPLGELFKSEEVRAVFLTDEMRLILPELEYLQQKSGQVAVPAESETNRSVEESGALPQDLPVVSRGEIEEYLTSLYSKSKKPAIELDPEILGRFTLDSTAKEDFSLVYDPASLKDLEKDPKEGIQGKKLVGLLRPYGMTSYTEGTGRLGSLNTRDTFPLPIGQTTVDMQIKDLTSWADKILEKIEQSWSFDQIASQGKKGTVGISVTITKSGEITSVDIIKSSGDEMLDLSAINAVKRSVPLPGLPIMYPAKSIVFTIEFEYNV